VSVQELGRRVSAAGLRVLPVLLADRRPVGDHRAVVARAGQQRRAGRPEKHPRRLVLDAIFYLVRGGIAWRQLPAGFPPPTTVYDRFRAWAKAGVWQVIHDALRDLGAPLPGP
jgi:transposase